jgi:hypothetical protein
MKLILEENQFIHVIQKITEAANNRSLLASRKAGIGSIFPIDALKNNPQRFRSYERERAGIEEIDLNNNWYAEDNSDAQL